LPAGAVLYGSSPHLIHARCSRYSYGVRYSGPHIAGAPDKEWHAEKKCYYTHKLFQKFVGKGEEVGGSVKHEDV
jgi:hypothetical protein